MRVGVVRSDLVEAIHEVTVAVVSDGSTVAVRGTDPTRPFFFRSALKPFQAAVTLPLAAELPTEQVALATASHGGQPVHVAHVLDMLETAGLDESALRCPADFPMSASAGPYARGAPSPRFHNCSGKHAAMARAAAAQGWSPEYLGLDHPLQRAVAAEVAEAFAIPGTPVGVDGCGVPTFQGTVEDLARGFGHLDRNPRYERIVTAMRRFPALTADADRPEIGLATWVPGAVKGGAEGCVGISLAPGVGAAAKAWSGAITAAVVGLTQVLEDLGLIAADSAARVMDAVAVVRGGGRVVGAWQVIE